MTAKTKILVYCYVLALLIGTGLVSLAYIQNQSKHQARQQLALANAEVKLREFVGNRRLTLREVSLRLRSNSGFFDLLAREDFAESQDYLDKSDILQAVDLASFFDFDGEHLFDAKGVVEQKDRIDLSRYVSTCRLEGQCSVIHEATERLFLIEVIPLSPHGTLTSFVVVGVDYLSLLAEVGASLEHIALGVSVYKGASFTNDPSLQETLVSVRMKKNINLKPDQRMFKEASNSRARFILWETSSVPSPFYSLFIYIALVPSLLLILISYFPLLMIRQHVEDPQKKLDNMFRNLESDQSENHPLQNADFEYETISSRLAGLMMTWRDRLDKAIERESEAVDKLERISDLAQIDDSEFSVLIAKINEITTDAFQLIDDYRAGKIKDNGFFMEMRSRASIILNYTNIFGIKKVYFAARKFMETLNVQRGKDKAEAADELEQSVYNVMFEMDHYMTIREIVLGKIIEDRDYLIITQLKYQRLKTLSLSDALGGKDGDLALALKRFDQENISDYAWRYNKHLATLSEAQRKVLKPIRIEGRPSLLSGKDMRILNDVVLHCIEFMVNQCVDTPDKRELRNLDPEAEISIHFSGGKPLTFDLKVTGTITNQRRLLREAVQAGVLDQEELEKVTTDDLARLVLKPLSQGFTVNNLSFVKEIVDSKTGDMSVDIGADSLSISVFLDVGQSKIQSINYPKQVIWGVSHPGMESEALKSRLEEAGVEIVFDATQQDLTKHEHQDTIIVDAHFVESDSALIISLAKGKVIFLARNFTKSEDQTYCKLRPYPPVVPVYPDLSKSLAQICEILDPGGTHRSERMKSVS